MDKEEIKKILWISGLKNAVEFGGKPNKKAVMGKLMAQRADLRSQAKIIMPLLDQIIHEIELMNLKDQEVKLLELDPTALHKEKKVEEEKELPELPNIGQYDKIIMRLAPYPSGALHIGNARMVILNDAYVQKYKGELYLFYDDTIGSPAALRNTPQAKYVLPEAYDLIKEGLDWLGVKIDKIFYKSDRLEIYYKYCERLIKEEMAYVCSCSAKDFRILYKDQKKECPHRSKSMEQNLNEWLDMLNGKYKEMEVVVRLKTGMDQKDPALRDQIIMRISEAEHPRVGTKYKVWPMLEFSWAIDDYLIGITHIIRGIDLVKEGVIEEFIWNYFGWKKANLLYYGRLRFPDLKLSKTEARNNIQNGIYSGWDDPRTWSMQSLKKRGIKPEALKKSLLKLGMSQNAVTFSVGWLYSENQAIIDEDSDRYFYVENPKRLSIKDVPFQNFIAEPLLLPSKPKKGVRKIKCEAENGIYNLLISERDFNKLKKKETLRLKDFVNITITEINKNGEIRARFHSRELIREFPIIHWVPQENIKVFILKPDGAMSKGRGEINLLNIPINTPIQFERYGFVNPIELKGDTLICYFTH
ncbi:MAG: glutamate--tRNA ligase [Promethearchaeota archaeon]